MKKFENDLIKLADVYTDYTIKCNCGHSVFVPASISKEICNWCGQTVYNTNDLGKKQKFYDEFKRAKGRLKKNENNKSNTI